MYVSRRKPQPQPKVERTSEFVNNNDRYNYVAIPLVYFMRLMEKTYLPNKKYVLIKNSSGVSLYPVDIPAPYLRKLKIGDYGIDFGTTNSEGKFDSKCVSNCNIKFFK